MKLKKGIKHQLMDKTRIKLGTDYENDTILDFQKRNELTKTQETYIQEMADLENCFFCERPSVYFFVCGHRLVCENCCKNFIQVCPHCKTKVTQIFNPASWN